MANSIFDEAANFSSKKNKKKASTPPPISTNNQKMTDNDAELSTILQKLNQMKNHLKEQFNELEHQGELKNIDIERFFHVMTQRFPDEIERLKECEKAINTEFTQIPSQPSPSQPPSTSSTDKMTHDRKSKMLGSRKKWISME